jgi:hypothetical protein
VTTQRFRYVRIPATASEAFPDAAFYLRPLIPVTLTAGRKSARLLALIDSGADNTLFSLQVAAMLGLNLRKAPADSFCGTSGHEQVARYRRLTVRVGTVGYPTLVGFAELPCDVAGILGQDGFFDRFTVTLDQARGLILLKHSRPLHRPASPSPATR